MNKEVGETHHAMCVLAGFAAVEYGPSAMVEHMTALGIGVGCRGNTTRIIRALCEREYLRIEVIPPSLRRTYIITKKGLARLREERTLLLKMCDLIDLVVPP